MTDIFNDPSWIPKGTIEKFFVLRKNHFVPSTSQSEPISPTDSNRRSVVRKLLKQQDNSGKSSLSNTDNVIKRLDEAIQSLENDKNKMAKNEDFTRRAPVRSNSLSAYYNKGSKNDSDACKLIAIILVVNLLCRQKIHTHKVYFFEISGRCL